MEMKCDLLQNWSFFKAQYVNYEIATSLNKKEDDIRVATLLSLLGLECNKSHKCNVQHLVTTVITTQMCR